VYGPLPNSEEFEEKTGWTYTNHEEDRGSRGRLGAELRATIYYLLSHAWVQGNNAVVRYWFGMSTRTLGKLEGEPYIKTEPCPVCKAACVQVPPDIVTDEGRVISFYQDIHNAPVHYVKVKTWEYIVRVKAPPPSKSRPLLPREGGTPGGARAGRWASLVQIRTNVTSDVKPCDQL
jgi:hypothetical protein